MADDYRPIDTAPRDGTQIEVMDPGCGSFLMRWNSTRETFWSLAGGFGLWECPGGNLTWCEDDGFGPTWWRPVAPASSTSSFSEVG